MHKMFTGWHAIKIIQSITLKLSRLMLHLKKIRRSISMINDNKTLILEIFSQKNRLFIIETFTLVTIFHDKSFTWLWNRDIFPLNEELLDILFRYIATLYCFISFLSTTSQNFTFKVNFLFMIQKITLHPVSHIEFRKCCNIIILFFSHKTDDLKCKLITESEPGNQT